jgi:hypothetical protein
LAYDSVVLDKDETLDREKLVIVTADGQIQKEIPWEEKWADILTWTNDQRLIIAALP